MAKNIVKPTNFYKLKKECELITKVALSGINKGDYSELINNIYEIKRALTNLQIVAREYRKNWKVKNEELKTNWYDAKRWNEDRGIDKRMCFYQQFKDLSSKNYLATIRVAARKMSNKCMKSYRDTGAAVCMRYFSLFTALDKQIHRLDTTLGKKVYELENSVELERERKEKNEILQEKIRKQIKTSHYKGKTYYHKLIGVDKWETISKEERKELIRELKKGI